MLLSSILITSDNQDEASLSTVMAENVQSLKDRHPSVEHKFFRQDDVLELLEAKFPKEVVDAYHALRPFSYRADLARYCILYEIGGVYADLSYYILAPIPLGEKPVVFRGNLVSSPWDTSNGLIYSPPRHKALELTIEMLLANVKRRYYGATSLCPTGPALFGRALAITCEAEELETGGALLVNRHEVEKVAPHVALPPDQIIHCQFLRMTWIAVKRKPLLSPGLTKMGVATGNVYKDLWDTRRVYA